MVNIKKIFKYIFVEFSKFSKKGIVAFVINAIFEPLPAFFVAILSKIILEFAMNNKEVSFVLKYLLLYSAFLFVLNVVVNISYNILWPLVVDFRFNRLTHLGKLTMELDYSFLEDYEVMENFGVAKASSSDNRNGFAGYILNLNRLVKRIVSFALNGAVLIYYLPLMIIPSIVVFVFNLRFNVKNNREIHEKEIEIIKEFDRKEEFFDSTVWDFSTGKEIRIFDIGQLILYKLKYIFQNKNDNLKEIENLEKNIHIHNTLIWGIFEASIYVYMVVLFLNGNLKIDSILMLIMIFALFKQSLSEISDYCSNLYKNSLEVSDYLSFIDSYSDSSREKLYGNIKIDEINTIEFIDVWFRYSDKSPYVLKGINFKLDHNDKLAIVGLNGNGKSTIIKLLLYFYKATKGKILINGLDINKIDKSSFYSLISTMFQDSNIYSFSVAENIAISNNFDEKRIISALERADIFNVVSIFDESINKMMLRLIDDNGYVPSGGQAQKINFARTLYRDPDLFILDEPSSYLDPYSESSMLKSIVDNSLNKSVIYISHRLKTIKFCNKIILLENGKIIEEGNFKQMIDYRGKFYNMYISQKELYD